MRNCRNHQDYPKVFNATAINNVKIGDTFWFANHRICDNSFGIVKVKVKRFLVRDYRDFCGPLPNMIYVLTERADGFTIAVNFNEVCHTKEEATVQRDAKIKENSFGKIIGKPAKAIAEFAA